MKRLVLIMVLPLLGCGPESREIQRVDRTKPRTDVQENPDSTSASPDSAKTDGRPGTGQTAKPEAGVETSDKGRSIEKKTQVHRFSSNKRAVYDAFTHINRLPEKAREGETPIDVAGNIFGRLANQEGRVLLKLPAGMDRNSYLAFKTFFRYEGKTQVGNCAACHTLAEFTDAQTHVVTKGGSPTITASLRNLGKRKVDLHKAILAKITASRQKQAGEAEGIDDAYAVMHISKEDVPGLVAFLNLLNDVPDTDFRGLILNAKVLDTSEDIE